MSVLKSVSGIVVASIVAAAVVACGTETVDPNLGDTESTEESLSGTVSVRAVHSGKCMDVAAWSTANGGKIHQWDCYDQKNQQWRLEDKGNGRHQVVSVHSGKCLDVSGVSKLDGAAVHQWTCYGSANQLWEFISVGNGQYQLRSVNSGKCLDVTGVSTANGAGFQQWSCGGGNNQRFTLTPVGSNLQWRQANLTNFTSYPDPGSEECIEYNGCTWAGYFAGIEGKQSEEWVKANNIAAVHSRDFDTYKLKTLRLRQGTRQIDVKVYDMCADSDCDGCCTQNASQTGFLIDIEKYTMERFGSGSGIVDWACLDC